MFITTLFVVQDKCIHVIKVKTVRTYFLNSKL